uniref:Uncharacterized protein n=1 Tax=Arundo donax TaxID=35708 RepID=A0A0A9G3M6_ARUDO
MIKLILGNRRINRSCAVYNDNKNFRLALVSSARPILEN